MGFVFFFFLSAFALELPPMSIWWVSGKPMETKCGNPIVTLVLCPGGRAFIHRSQGSPSQMSTEAKRTQITSQLLRHDHQGQQARSMAPLFLVVGDVCRRGKNVVVLTFERFPLHIPMKIRSFSPFMPYPHSFDMMFSDAVYNFLYSLPACCIRHCSRL